MRAYIEVVCILLFGCITHFSAILTTLTGTSLILTGTFRKVLHRPSSWFIKSIKYFVYIKSVKVHKSPLRFNVATTFQKYFGILPKYAYTLISILSFYFDSLYYHRNTFQCFRMNENDTKAHPLNS